MVAGRGGEDQGRETSGTSRWRTLRDCLQSAPVLMSIQQEQPVPNASWGVPLVSGATSLRMPEMSKAVKHSPRRMLFDLCSARRQRYKINLRAVLMLLAF